MQRPDQLPQQAPESLAGCWHSIGVLQLRRLLLEGATLILQECDTTPHPIGAGTFVMPENANPECLQWCIPDLDTPLVCVGPGWGPAQELASQLHNAGYQHVFTPETDWGGMIAINGAGGRDQR